MFRLFLRFKFNMDNKLKIAIQKSGRLSEGSVRLLRKCGIHFGNGLGKLRSEALNFPLEIFFLRDDDIPNYVADAVADIGIVGENVIAEKPCRVKTIERLGFGNCRLSIALPKSASYAGPGDLRNKRIATSYPRVLGGFLARHGIEAELHTIGGSVEIAPSIGLADAVCDLVSSGSTLFSNGLREVECVMRSEAVLIGRGDLGPDRRGLLEKLLFRIRAGRAAEENKYILLNAPDERLERIIDVLPGMRSPSVLPLAETGWSSVHSVVAEDDFWEVVEELKELGAEGILVLSVEQMIR